MSIYLIDNCEAIHARNYDCGPIEKCRDVMSRCYDLRDNARRGAITSRWYLEFVIRNLPRRDGSFVRFDFQAAARASPTAANRLTGAFTRQPL